MLDNQIISILISSLIAGEAVTGISGTPIAQAFQPTMQGVNTKPTAFIFKVSDRRYGFPFWADIWDQVHSKMVHSEIQQYETTFQLSALSSQNPAAVNQYTASDILNLCAAILQSQKTVASLQAQGVGMERVSDIRNPYFTDDRQQFQASPSFDFVVTHKQIITSETPILQSEEFQLIEI